MASIDSSSLYKTHAAYEAAMAFYDQQIASLGVPYQTQDVETRHGQTRVLTAGSPTAPPLIFWHGMNANLTSWIGQIQAFSAHYHVIVADAPGSTGRSDPRRLDRKSLAYGEWAADTLKALRIKQAHHVGISGGGWQIIKLANVAPDMIQSATLISSAGFFPVNPTLIIRLLPYMLFSKPETAARKFLKIMSPPDYTPPQDEVTAFGHLFNFKSERSIPVVSDVEIRALTAPVALLMAQYEVTYRPQKVIDRARQLLPNLKHAQIVEGVGHGMTGEKPEVVHQLITEWLSSQ